METVMKKYAHYGVALIIFLLNSLESYCKENCDSTNRAFQAEASYTGDFLRNFSGGIRTGNVYLGKMNFGLGISTRDLGLWSGGSLFIMAENVHGPTPSEELIGDSQVASNIETGNYTYLFMAWYRHEAGPLEITIGLNDLNADFHVTENSGGLLNSSFGIMPTSSMNMPVPIFPKTALGAVFSFDAGNSLSLLAGIYDGDPLSLDEDQYNTNLSISRNEGYLSIAEVHLQTKTRNLAGTYKLGYQYHSARFLGLEDTSHVGNGIGMVYLLGDQQLLSSASGLNVNTFFQCGYSSPKYSYNPFYIGAGINLSGFWRKRATDELNIGIASASLEVPGDNKNTAETVFELNYNCRLNSLLSVQPDFQYIVNPGSSNDLANAFVGILRINIEI